MAPFFGLPYKRFKREMVTQNNKKKTLKCEKKRKFSPPPPKKNISFKKYNHINGINYK